MKKRCLSLSIIVTIAFAFTLTSVGWIAAGPEEGLDEVLSTDFSDGAKDWTPTDPNAWKVIKDGDKDVYAIMKKKSDYKPPVRSPYNRTIYQGAEVSDFVYDVELRSTTPYYNHRDLCLFFGYQDESHFYYVHFGQEADPHSNSIFLVNDAPRVSIANKTTKGTKWDDEFHHVRIVRNVEHGLIEVYFDDMENPIMVANDKTFTHGKVGIGSFDDQGNFNTVKLWGNKVK